MSDRKLEKNASGNAFEGIREGHTAITDDQWRERLQLFLDSQSDVRKPVRVTEVTRPAGGLSAINIIFKVEHDGVGTRYVARVEPEKSIYLQHNLFEQFETYRYLNSIGLPVPNALWIDQDGKYLGRAGFVMEFWAGESSTTSYFTDGPLSRASDEQRFRMLHHMVDVLAEIHLKADPNAIKSLSTKWRGETWIEREINFWWDLGMDAHPELSAFYGPLRDWLLANAPSTPDPVFLHGDFYGSNVLWIGEKISAILDLESIHIGPRESDVVYHYCIDQIASNFFTQGIKVPSLAQRAVWYKEASGIELRNLDYHEARIMFQLALAGVVIAREAKQDLAISPTPYMNFLNRRLLSALPFKHRMPIIEG